MELPETHIIILIVAGAGLGLVLLYEIIRSQWSKCRGIDDGSTSSSSPSPDPNKSSSCQKLEETPPSYESLFP